jgi:hypothetical protein
MRPLFFLCLLLDVFEFGFYDGVPVAVFAFGPVGVQHCFEAVVAEFTSIVGASSSG